MTRYDEMDEHGGHSSARGRPAPEPLIAAGDTDWGMTSYGSSADQDAGHWEASDSGPDTGGWSGQDTGGWPARGTGRGKGAGRGKNASRDSGSGDRARPVGMARLMHPSRHAMLGAAAIIAMFAVVSMSLAAYAQYRGVYDSIRRENVTSAMLGKRPPYTAGLNILVIGSDSRAGLGRKFGTGIDGARSDTMMLLHIAPGHTRADIISFPRDSMVPIIACQADGVGDPGQQAQPGQLERLNSTFAYGGAPCLWKTLEQVTGIRIDHFIEVDFTGFESIVNDVGGVPVCLPYAVNNPLSGLNLSAGKHMVTGAQALAFVRTRENTGDGSDTERIQRQQFFLAAVMQKLKATNLLAQPTRIYAVVRDAAKSLTTDSGLDLSTMLRIADSMKSLNSSAVQFITVPNGPYPGDPAAELIWAQPQADNLFKAIEDDQGVPAPAAKKAAPAAKPTVTESPAQVNVQVLNGSGVAGVASTAATALTGAGFHVTGQGNATNFNFTSNVIEYSSPAQLTAVNTLKARLSSVQVQQNAALAPGTISLILGSSFTGSLASAGSSSSSSSSSRLAQSYGGITANTNICSDSTAFAGPFSTLPGG